MSDLTTKIADLDNGFSAEQIKQLHLIEASAGTGKTYSIQTLYLRLVLVEKLNVQQILTVTFTKDATKELRDRLQKALSDALGYITGTLEIPDEADRTRRLVDRARGVNHEHDETVKQCLQLALLDFDTAAIYTIHGFCQRMLKKFAFETKQAFDSEPAGDSSDEIELLCKDWWRRNMYNRDKKIAGFLSASNRFSLEIITRLAKKIIAKPDAKLLPEFEGITGSDEAIKAKLKDFPVQKNEDSDFAGKPESIQEALQSFQADLNNFREYLRNEEWDKAISTLQTVVEKKQEVENPCKKLAETLKSVCIEFKEKHNRAQAKSFQIDADGLLIHKSNPAPEHSNNIKIAVQALKNEIERCSPLGVINMRAGKPVKAYESMDFLYNHFFPAQPGQREQTTDPKPLLEAITALTGTASVVTDKVMVTVGEISPDFTELHETLIKECVHAVCGAALEIREKYRETRPAAVSATYDDYLVNLRDALAEPGLLAALRDEFKAALIDEFQDTDPVQWGIFEKLFKDSGIPCFLVGDPKQAIYRFRNGDVETYKKATAGIAAKYPLKKNFRSEKRLIDAVNQIFIDENGAKTFGEGIDYNEPLDAAGKDSSLLISGEPDQKPFKIILIPDSAKGLLPGKNSPSAMQAYKLTAEKIAEILNDKNMTIGGRNISRKDIAVLVNKHDHAEYIAKALSDLNIPAVRQGTGNVWQTDEGKVMWAVLDAVLDSRDASKVKRALITAWCSVTLEQVQGLDQGVKLVFNQKEYALEDFISVFDDFRETWIKRGFPAMFRKIMRVFNVKKKLLGADDRRGQRRLTNINHLSELVEQKIIKDRKTPEGVLSWVRLQFDEETADSGEDMTLRLETDDDAVGIQTIFTSKGLEYPIVFAPTLFMMQPVQREGIYEFHDDDGNLNVVRSLGKDPVSDTAKKREQEETCREYVRQIYVALTRAVHRTVVVALNDGAKDGKPKRNEQQKFKGKGVLGQVLRLPMKKEDNKESGVVDLEKVPERFGNIPGVACAIEVEAADVSCAEPVETSSVEISPPREKPDVDTSKGHGSFSSLAPGERKKGDEPAPVVSIAQDEKNRDSETSELQDTLIHDKPSGIFAFPSGAKTGTCWHEIFEDISFSANDETIRQVAEEKLGIHGFLKNKDKQEERTELTCQMVKNVLQTQLPALNGKTVFRLNETADNDRKTEWSFSFSSLPEKRTTELKEAVSAYSQYKLFTDDLGEWDREIPGGYLTGFVDLLCRKNNCYYIVDWKSNRRNGVQEDFSQSRLRGEISLHRYWLQYLIYSVAAHQYLSKAMDGYKYETHFGGVYYIFLRGVDGGQDNDGNVNGIYADLPPKELVEKLSNILGDFS